MGEKPAWPHIDGRGAWRPHRAVGLCQSTLSYGRAQEPPPHRRRVALESVVEEVRSMAGISSKTSISWNTAIERGLLIDADPDQLFRVLLNQTHHELAPNPGDQRRAGREREQDR
jgi:hypothetical protein